MIVNKKCNNPIFQLFKSKNKFIILISQEKLKKECRRYIDVLRIVKCDVERWK